MLASYTSAYNQIISKLRQVMNTSLQELKLRNIIGFSGNKTIQLINYKELSLTH